MFESSFLRNGAQFHGIQKSDGNKTFDVSVTVLHVNMEQSMLCGFFKISGLSGNNSSLTTYFEAEIIGDKFGFLTKWPEWGASESTDYKHWKRLGAFQYAKRKVPLRRIKPYDPWKKGTIYMRWKELAMLDKVNDFQFRSRNSSSDVSFEGFYYIAFSQRTGRISGYYYHYKFDHFQYLELDPVVNRMFPILEFQ
ncbi:Vid24 family cytoplasmic vesicle protein [Schizosaccharomyces octosporus yFS286]|uniref:Vid24 family cytoplasmic vesicle protein n=1 Tax=Schizosaccharomyces octosporus (strain yFS286) TaxID=483514 RepID=S9PYV1_SCHOY|nr:Vid24 family cytoplasmic vesicle protein [Schizosaccharomyces octosporus yFS286]EPX72593.1 Vid24 family cytoplasmic vesicle protein [Schizosaccharomyces octosporus yFS286]